MIEEKLIGNGLNERHKNFNNLISRFSHEEFTSDLITKLLAGKRLDKVFLAKVAIREKNPRVICELLKSEDTLVVSKALKADWFFKCEADNEIVDLEYFFETVYPVTTYATQCKLITSFSIFLNNTTVAEELYSKLREKYNNTNVIKLLPKCSEKFIEGEIKTKKIEIPEAQFIYLYSKYPLLVIDYIEDRLKNKKRVENVDKIFRKISSEYPDKFHTMYKEYWKLINLKLSYRETILFVQEYPEYVVENVKNIYSYLNVRAVHNVLRGEMRDRLMIKLIPKDVKERPYEFLHFTEHWKPEFIVKYIDKLYKSHHNVSVWELHWLDKRLIEYLPLEMRQKYVDSCVSRNKNSQEDYLEYCSADVAMKCYKKLACITSNVNQRISLLKRMINCCKINRDNNMLLDLLKYIAKRHRNDGHQLRTEVLVHLKTSFKLNELSDNHWKIIDEMINVMFYNAENEQYYAKRVITDIMKEKLLYNLKNGLDIEPVIKILVEQKVDDLIFISDNIEYQKKVIDSFHRQYETLLKNTKDKEKNNKIAKLLLSSICKWNETYRNEYHSLTEYPWIIKAIENWLIDIENIYDSDTNMLLKDHKATEMFANIIFQKTSSTEVLKTFLKYDINIIMNNIETLVKTCVSHIRLHSVTNHNVLYSKINTYFDDPIGRELKQKLTARINTPSPVELSSRTGAGEGCIVAALSSFMSSSDYETILQQYVPTSTRTNPGDNDIEKEKYVYQRTEVIICNFKHISPPISYESLLLYAKGDYFKFALPSVLSICSKKGHNETVKFIYDSLLMPVSIKKHAIRLSYKFFDRKMLPSFYREMWNNEKNTSIRDVLFQKTFQLFKSNEDLNVMCDMLEILKFYFASFEEKDKNLFKFLSMFNDIHDEFISEYCKSAWNTIKRLKSLNIDIMDREMSTFISNCNNNILKFDDEFCNTVVDDSYIYLSENSLKMGFFNFYVSYLIQAKTAIVQQKRISCISGILEKYISEYWDKDVDEKFPFREILSDLVLSCLSQIFNNKYFVDPLPVLSEILEVYNSVLPLGATFYHNVLLKLGILFIESTNETVPPQKLSSITELNDPHLQGFFEKFADKFLKTYNELISFYGLELLNTCAETVNSFMSAMHRCFEIDNDALYVIFIKQLLNANSNEKHVLYLAIYLLPKHVYNESLDFKNMYSSIINQIILNSDTAMKIILDDKIQMSSARLFGISID